MPLGTRMRPKVGVPGYQATLNTRKEFLPRKTIHVRSEKAKKVSEAHCVSIPTLMTLISDKNRFKSAIPTIPPKPCIKNRKAMNTPNVAGPQQRGVRRTNNDTTPLIPITPRLTIPSDISNMMRFLRPSFLGLL